MIRFPRSSGRRCAASLLRNGARCYLSLEELAYVWALVAWKLSRVRVLGDRSVRSAPPATRFGEDSLG